MGEEYGGWGSFFFLSLSLGKPIKIFRKKGTPSISNNTSTSMITRESIDNLYKFREKTQGTCL